ncbi:hypothetical protein MRB53_033570 [Persea americana]|uniref:Uncharacterized protein n=1 Tax=Persea americana TaxID=3435 RepID=A0ACC2KVQ8_PERAE|nr:hypothetical protein MRB53_033570 [Persea americana]|eukprot:TRINITY_DN91262_c0_g1_i1.p1 TRINITY_DN91262_c0_g1~~TRINITY_DN91262_c0_g1_i1.p1  ORF type:complete len:205 (-),score=58.47 TRINITY_DN91262_c0_g1_i1:268-882(-)
MAMARSLTATNLGGLHLPPRCTSHSLVRLPHSLLGTSTSKISYGFLAIQEAKSLAGGLLRFKINAKMSNDLQTAVPKTPKPVSPNWVVSLVVSVLSLILPGWKTQLQMFLKLENEVEKVIENTAEAVEKVAEEAEKVMEQVEHDLPEGSKLKETVLVLEHATEEAQKDAKLALDLIHKVDEIKDEVEAVVEPVINPVEFIKKEA